MLAEQVASVDLALSAEPALVQPDRRFLWVPPDSPLVDRASRALAADSKELPPQVVLEREAAPRVVSGQLPLAEELLVLERPPRFDVSRTVEIVSFVLECSSHILESRKEIARLLPKALPSVAEPGEPREAVRLAPALTVPAYAAVLPPLLDHPHLKYC